MNSLGPIDRYLIEIMEISRVKARIKCCVTFQTFNETFDMVSCFARMFFPITQHSNVLASNSLGHPRAQPSICLTFPLRNPLTIPSPKPPPYRLLYHRHHFAESYWVAVSWEGKLLANAPVSSQSSYDSFNSSVASMFLYQDGELQLFGLKFTIIALEVVILW